MKAKEKNRNKPVINLQQKYRYGMTSRVTKTVTGIYPLLRAKALALRQWEHKGEFMEK